MVTPLPGRDSCGSCDSSLVLSRRHLLLVGSLRALTPPSPVAPPAAPDLDPASPLVFLGKARDLSLQPCKLAPDLSSFLEHRESTAPSILLCPRETGGPAFQTLRAQMDYGHVGPSGSLHRAPGTTVRVQPGVTASVQSPWAAGTDISLPSSEDTERQKCREGETLREKDRG